MEKLNGKSKDVVVENIEKLKQIFPDIITDGNIDFDKLKEALGEFVDEREERYNFTWNGKAQAKRIAQTPSTGTLRPAKEEGVNWDNTKNIFIEGDNLEVLKLLQKTYHKKIKMIYIDPPYNTGKDFVYKDDYKDNIKNYKKLTGQIDDTGNALSTNTEASGRFHTDWLNMMYPRLKLARNLLHDDGIIFISIDDSEVNNLRRICDEIYGEENFVGIIVWKNKFGAGAKTKGFIGVHEYILTYSKTPIQNITRPLNDEERENYNKTRDEKFETRGGYVTQPLAVTTFDDRPSLRYPVIYDGKEIWPEKQWVWSKERMERAIANNEVVFNLQKDGSYKLRSKKYLIDENGEERKGKPTSFYSDVYTQNGTNDIRDLFGKVIFDYTKPVDLMKYLISFEINEIPDKDFIVLDFFAGSAPAAQAAMELNKKDGGARKFVMVQLPEPCPEKSEAFKDGYKTIADIGKERIRRAIGKIKNVQEDNKRKDQRELFDDVTQGVQLDLGFKVFKLDSSNIATWDPEFDTLEKDLLNVVDNIKDERTEEDVLYEVLLKYGLDLTLPIEDLKIGNKKVHSIGHGALIVCLDKDISLDVADGIGKFKEKYKPEVMRVVFKDNSFKDDVVKTNAVQILKQYEIDDIKSL